MKYPVSSIPRPAPERVIVHVEMPLPAAPSSAGMSSPSGPAGAERGSESPGETAESCLRETVERVVDGCESRADWQTLVKTWNGLVRLHRSGRLGVRGQAMVRLLSPVIYRYGEGTSAHIESDPALTPVALGVSHPLEQDYL